MPDDHRQATTQVITVDDRFGTHTMDRTLRREPLDRILILNRRHLEHVLAEYTTNFNQHRPLQHAAPFRQLSLPSSQPDFSSDVAIGSAG